MADERVHVELSTSEALVLFEWLWRTGEEKSLPIIDHSEQVVLWRVEGQLENQLIAPMLPDYDRAVAAARKEVRGD